VVSLKKTLTSHSCDVTPEIVQLTQKFPNFINRS